MLLVMSVGIVALLLPAPVRAQDETPPSPTITITESTEDGEHLLIATVMLDGEPLEGVEVIFSAVRSFGLLELGSEETFDDGTAAVTFPEGLPGDAQGRFDVQASVEESDDYGASSGTASFHSDVSVAPVRQMFPEALWSPRPLWPLVAVIGVLLAGVWSTYGVVVVHLLKIHRKESPS